MLSFLFGGRKAVPRRNTVFIESHALSFSVSRARTVLEAALEAGIAFPHDCKVGTCGTCRFQLKSGDIRELNSSAVALSADEIANGWRLGCQSIPHGDLTITLPGLISEVGPPPTLFEAAIASVVPMTHDIVELRLRLNRPVTFVAGQFAELECDAVQGARSYSFAGWPEEGSTLEPIFYVRKVPGGAFTGWLFSQDRVGAPLTMRAPFGTFRLRKGQGRIVMVGGGSGLAPLKCMLERWVSEETRPVTLLYGARTLKDLFCVEEMAAIGRNWQAEFKLLPVLSMEDPGSPWTGARGMVTEYLDQVPDVKSAQAYLCGPPPMVDAAEAALIKRGMARDTIFADRFFDRSHLAEEAGTGG